MRKATIVREGGEKDVILADTAHLDSNTDVLTFQQGDPEQAMSTAQAFKVVAQYNWHLIQGYMWQEALEVSEEEETSG